jgi:hypothetical protein
MTTATTIKLREYQDLWLRIAAADSGTPVIVRCSKNYSKTLIQAVRKEKCIANNNRKNFDMPRYGTMHSEIKPVEDSKHHVQIFFTLTYNGDQL